MVEIIDACYFCTTPYQIIGAISLVEANKEKADLYIIGQFSSFLGVAKRIERLNIFSKVIAVNEDEMFSNKKKVKNKIIRRMIFLKFYLNIKTIGDKFIEPNRIYKKVYSTSQAFAIRVLCFYLLRYYKDVEFIYFDDGVGSYYGNIFNIRQLDKIARRLLFGKKSTDYKSKRILYIPELCLKTQKELCSETIKMPRIINNNANVERLNYIFNFKPKDILTEKIIIMDTLKEELYGNKGVEVLEHYYQMIFDRFGYNNVIMKKHPRDIYTKSNDVKYYENYEIPSEILYFNIDIEEIIIISVNSTSVITPKLMINKEPIVIMLYKLMDIYGKPNKEENEFFYSFKNMYTDKAKFHIPKNEIELENILNSIKRDYDEFKICID